MNWFDRQKQKPLHKDLFFWFLLVIVVLSVVWSLFTPARAEEPDPDEPFMLVLRYLDEIGATRAMTLGFGTTRATCWAKLAELMQGAEPGQVGECVPLKADIPEEMAPEMPQQRLQAPRGGFVLTQSEHMVPGHELTVHERVERCRFVAADALKVATWRLEGNDAQALKDLLRTDADPGDREQTLRVVDMAYAYPGSPWDFAMLIFRSCVHGELHPYTTMGGPHE